MDSTMNERIEQENGNISDQQQASSYGLLLITRAYNQREITFDEWLKRSRQWAENIIKQYGGDGT